MVDLARKLYHEAIFLLCYTRRLTILDPLHVIVGKTEMMADFVD